MAHSPKHILRVGLIGIGEVAQAIHLPTLALLSHLYTVTAICDISRDALTHCAAKFHIKATYTVAADLCADPNVDVVFILTSDEIHESYTVMALQCNKHVLVEKPVAMSLAAAQRMADAEQKSQGRIFVAYMRRYAAALSTFKAELPPREDIKFARVRDIIGPNPHFVMQSGTFPQRFSDYPVEANAERVAAGEALVKEALDGYGELTPLMVRFHRFLGALGSHDLSVMREVLGKPRACTAASFHVNGMPFATATFEYGSFVVAYESGLDGVPRFDSHLQVYGKQKTVRLEFDSPYIKGLPVKIVVEEAAPGGGFVKREILVTYEDAYTQELVELHDCLVEGKEIKTTVEDAMEDLDVFQMVLRKAFIAT